MGNSSSSDEGYAGARPSTDHANKVDSKVYSDQATAGQGGNVYQSTLHQEPPIQSSSNIKLSPSSPRSRKGGGGGGEGALASSSARLSRRQQPGSTSPRSRATAPPKASSSFGLYGGGSPAADFLKSISVPSNLSDTDDQSALTDLTLCHSPYSNPDYYARKQPTQKQAPPQQQQSPKNNGKAFDYFSDDDSRRRRHGSVLPVHMRKINTMYSSSGDEANPARNENERGTNTRKSPAPGKYDQDSVSISAGGVRSDQESISIRVMGNPNKKLTENIQPKSDVYDKESYSFSQQESRSGQESSLTDTASARQIINPSRGKGRESAEAAQTNREDEPESLRRAKYVTTEIMTRIDEKRKALRMENTQNGQRSHGTGRDYATMIDPALIEKTDSNGKSILSRDADEDLNALPLLPSESSTSFWRTRKLGLSLLDTDETSSVGNSSIEKRELSSVGNSSTEKRRVATYLSSGGSSCGKRTEPTVASSGKFSYRKTPERTFSKDSSTGKLTAPTWLSSAESSLGKRTTPTLVHLASSSMEESNRSSTFVVPKEGALPSSSNAGNGGDKSKLVEIPQCNMSCNDDPFSLKESVRVLLSGDELSQASLERVIEVKEYINEQRSIGQDGNAIRKNRPTRHPVGKGRQREHNLVETQTLNSEKSNGEQVKNENQQTESGVEDASSQRGKQLGDPDGDYCIARSQDQEVEAKPRQKHTLRSIYSMKDKDDDSGIIRTESVVKSIHSIVSGAGSISSTTERSVQEKASDFDKNNDLSVNNDVYSPFQEENEDDEFDMVFIRKYEEFFGKFIWLHPNICRGNEELQENLRAAKLQKIMEVAMEAEATLEKRLESLQRNTETRDYQSMIATATREKADKESELHNELQAIQHATKAMEGRLMWQAIDMCYSSAKKQQKMLKDLFDKETDPTDMLELLPDIHETQAIRDAVTATPEDTDTIDEKEKELREFQLENAFLKAEVQLLEKKMSQLEVAARKHAWVDSIFLRLDKKQMKIMQNDFREKIGVEF